jgi:hypothetical protein
MHESVPRRRDLNLRRVGERMTNPVITPDEFEVLMGDRPDEYREYVRRETSLGRAPFTFPTWCRIMDEHKACLRTLGEDV